MHFNAHNLALLPLLALTATAAPVPAADPQSGGLPPGTIVTSTTTGNTITPNFSGQIQGLPTFAVNSVNLITSPTDPRLGALQGCATDLQMKLRLNHNLSDDDRNNFIKCGSAVGVPGGLHLTWKDALRFGVAIFGPPGSAAILDLSGLANN